MPLFVFQIGGIDLFTSNYVTSERKRSALKFKPNPEYGSVKNKE
jgi:hypothetical protein